MRASATILLACAVACVTAEAARACNVPVFRYALERWRPDPYRVTLLHRGPLSDSDRALVAPLQSQEEAQLSNIALRIADVEAFEDPEDERLAASVGDVPLPLLVLQYPDSLRIGAPLWSGPLNARTVESLAQSPLRRELVRRLVDGESAVWLLLESGDKLADDAAAALVEEELARVGKSLRLPDLADSPDDELRAAAPLRIAFSVLRVPRGAAEAPLVAMLLSSEPDLAERVEPLVFPVFGRGRALLPLVGRGITPDNLQGAAAFLVGACSCQVKEQNPGFDLLVAADWDTLLSQPPRSNEPADSAGPAELVPIPKGTPTAAAPPAPAAEAGSPPATIPTVAISSGEAPAGRFKTPAIGVLAFAAVAIAAIGVWLMSGRGGVV